MSSESSVVDRFACSQLKTVRGTGRRAEAIFDGAAGQREMH